MKHNNYNTLMSAYKKGNKEIDKLVHQLVIEEISDYIWETIHKHYYFCPEMWDDMYQEACLSIMSHLTKYNPEYALTTFCKPYINGAMYEFVARSKNLSKNDLCNGKKIFQAIEELSWVGNDNPTAEEIAKKINQDNITKKVVVNFLKMNRRATGQISVDAWMEKHCGKNGHRNLGKVNDSLHISPNLLRDWNEKTDVEGILLSNERVRVITEALNKLTELERSVLIDLYYDEVSLRKVAEKHNTTTDEIKKVKEQAFSKMYIQLKSYRLGENEQGDVEFVEYDNQVKAKDYIAVVNALNDCIGMHANYRVIADGTEMFEFETEAAFELEL